MECLAFEEQGHRMNIFLHSACMGRKGASPHKTRVSLNQDQRHSRSGEGEDYDLKKEMSEGEQPSPAVARGSGPVTQPL